MSSVKNLKYLGRVGPSITVLALEGLIDEEDLDLQVISSTCRGALGKRRHWTVHCHRGLDGPLLITVEGSDLPAVLLRAVTGGLKKKVELEAALTC